MWEFKLAKLEMAKRRRGARDPSLKFNGSCLSGRDDASEAQALVMIESDEVPRER